MDLKTHICACMYMHITSNRYNKYTNIDDIKIEGIILNKYNYNSYEKYNN